MGDQFSGKDVALLLELVGVPLFMVVRGLEEEPDTLITTGVPGARGWELSVTNVGAESGTATELSVCAISWEETMRGSFDIATYFNVAVPVLAPVRSALPDDALKFAWDGAKGAE